MVCPRCIPSTSRICRVPAWGFTTCCGKSSCVANSIWISSIWATGYNTAARWLTRHNTNPRKACWTALGRHSTGLCPDETTSHSTKPSADALLAGHPKDDSQVAGYERSRRRISMKTRLCIFIFSLVLLPLAGLLLSGKEWSELSTDTPATGTPAAAENIAAILLTALMLLGYVLLSNHMIKRRTGNSPMNIQRNYFLWMAAASAMLGWLLAYLNLFTASWPTEQGNPVVQLLLYTPLFALLAPAVLSTRALLGAFPGLLKRLSRGISLPIPSGETLAFSLVPIAALGLLGGAVWPAQLFWLLWIAPLLSLIHISEPT